MKLRSVTAEQILEALNMHRDHTLGIHVKGERLHALGRIAWVVAMPASGEAVWRSDAELRMQAFLADILDPDRFEHDQPTIAITVKTSAKHFGVTTFPQDWEDLALEVDRQSSTLSGNVRRHVGRLIGPADSWLDEHAVPHDLETKTLAAPRPWTTWRTSDGSRETRGSLREQWPPIDVRWELLNRLRKGSDQALVFNPPLASTPERVRAQLEADRHVLTLGRASAHGVDPQLTWQLLRQLAAESALTYLRTNIHSPKAAAAAGGITRYILRDWGGQGPLVPVDVDDGQPLREPGHSWVDVAAAVLNRAFWSCVAGPDRSAFLRRARREAPAGLGSLDLVLRRQHRPSMIVIQASADRPDTHFPLFGDPRTADRNLRQRLESLDRTARMARENKFGREVAIRSWLNEVWLVLENHISPADAIELAVQRQGLLWDAASSYTEPNMPSLYDQLAAIRPLEAVEKAQLQSRTLHTLQLLDGDEDRAKAVALRKGPRPQLAASRDAGERAATRWEKPGLLGSVGPIGLDLAQQDYLAQAGFYVTRLETHLTLARPDRQAERILHVAARAQSWASAALSTFEALGVELLTTRWDQQHRLAIPLWEVITRFQELRALTGVLVCLRSGLFSEAAWHRQINASWDNTQGPRPASDYHGLWEQLLNGYFKIMEHELVTERDFGSIRQQALGMLLVSPTGMLPVPKPIDETSRRGPGAQFIHELQNDQSPYVGEVRRDPREITDALRRQSFKLGWIGRIQQGGPVWKVLKEREPLLAAIEHWKRTI